MKRRVLNTTKFLSLGLLLGSPFFMGNLLAADEPVPVPDPKVTAPADDAPVKPAKNDDPAPASDLKVTAPSGDAPVKPAKNEDPAPASDLKVTAPSDDAPAKPAKDEDTAPASDLKVTTPDKDAPVQPAKDEDPSKGTSFAPIIPRDDFQDTMARMKDEKAGILDKQMQLLNQRYDLSDRPLAGVTMSAGKAIQGGVRVKLGNGMTWDQLGAMSPGEIQGNDAFPLGFLPLPHPNHKEGGMVFPQSHIDEIKKQEGRDLTRFDLDLDIPERFHPEFPAPIYLTTRPDLGDVSQGKLVTSQNFYEIFNGILTPKQLDGLRLLVVPFAQQQFNLTDDRRSARPSMGVSCFDCHANGNGNAATHLDPQTRPQENRRRLDIPTLRGVRIQELFGSQRSLRSIEDFTEFEQRGAYFDGDPLTATKKGVNILERGTQVANMAEFQSILDFPPAPKLDREGKLDPALASPAELKGQDLFFGKASCGACHQAPFYTDNSMHNLETERFYKPHTINGKKASGEGPIKTFPLRGIKDTPPYLHDGRLLTLEDTVEFFNMVLGVKLTEQEKADLVTFMLAL